MTEDSLNLLTPALPRADGQEIFEAILQGPGGLLVERIVSHGQTTPEGEWYDQTRDEWVLVLEGSAELELADGKRISLARGEHCFLPKHLRHRVSRTSSPCLWLAVHSDHLKIAPTERLADD